MSDLYAYELMPSAIQDSDSIAEYIAVQLSAEDSAVRLLNEIEAAIIAACAFPYAAPSIHDELFQQKGYRKLVAENYIVFYIPDDEKRRLNVMRVVYFAKDYLKEL